MPLPTSVTSVEDLIDRAAILNAAAGYASGIDRRDWALYRHIFADTVELDFSTANGFRAVMPADEWLGHVKASVAGFDATQHDLTNPIIRIDGNQAVATFHMIARHIVGGEQQLMGGYYDYHLTRAADGWKITVVRLVVEWEQGDRAVFEAGAAGAKHDA